MFVSVCALRLSLAARQGPSTVHWASALAGPGTRGIRLSSSITRKVSQLSCVCARLLGASLKSLPHCGHIRARDDITPDRNGERQNVAGGVALHAVAGFLGRGKVSTAHLVEAGGDLPVIVTFVDTDEHVQRVLPKLREMAAHRLMVRENVVIEQGSLD